MWKSYYVLGAGGAAPLSWVAGSCGSRTPLEGSQPWVWRKHPSRPFLCGICRMSHCPIPVSHCLYSVPPPHPGGHLSWGPGILNEGQSVKHTRSTFAEQIFLDSVSMAYDLPSSGGYSRGFWVSDLLVAPSPGTHFLKSSCPTQSFIFFREEISITWLDEQNFPLCLMREWSHPFKENIKEATNKGQHCALWQKQTRIAVSLDENTSVLVETVFFSWSFSPGSSVCGPSSNLSSPLLIPPFSG